MIHLALVIICVGVLLWAANTYIPMAASIKTLLNVVVVVCLVIYLLSVFDILGTDIPVPRVHR